MKNIKKVLMMFLTVAMVMGALAGCGKSSETPDWKFGFHRRNPNSGLGSRC